MRIATIINWAYGITVVLTLASGAAMIAASRAEDRERAAVEQRWRFDQLTGEVEEDLFLLSEQARLYALNGNLAHLTVYRDELRDLGSVDSRVRKLRDVGAQPAELDALRRGLHWADSLRDEQQAAIAAVQRHDAETARAIVFGAEYERDLERAATMIDRFHFLIDQRTEQVVAAATAASRSLRSTSEAMLAVTALLVLFVLSFVIRHRILRPVVRLSDVVARLAEQDYAVEPPSLSQVDEIGDMAQAIRVFRDNGLERQRLERQRDADRAMRDLLARMTQRLQGCDTRDDLAEVVELFLPQIVPAFAGRLYVLDPDSELLTSIAAWHGPRRSAPEFASAQCWAVRRGQIHRPRGGRSDVPCAHVAAGADETFCVPLAAQGDIIGLLYFEQQAAEVEIPAEAHVYIELLAENVGLALANLRLRDALRRMALVDALTGLSNRHQLETVLKLQAAQATRSGEPLSCAMVDVDHFKRFNDDFGHDAGDAVLTAVGEILGNSVREDGMAFRYGGEEFLLLLPGLGDARAAERCEDIRRRIKALRLHHDGKALGPITASIGIATSPDHGPADTLVQTADAALLRAKAEGRDRVLVALERAT